MLFFLPKWPAEKREIVHNRAKMCKKRFFAIPPLVIPPFACHREKPIKKEHANEFGGRYASEVSRDGLGANPGTSGTSPDLISVQLDDRQITHPICVRLKHLLYDFFRGVLGLLHKKNNRKEAQNTP